MRRTGLSAALLALGLGGCVHYAAAPPQPAKFIGEFDAQTLEAGAARTWTAAELLSLALAKNPQIAEARAKYQTSLAAMRTAKAYSGSSLTLTAEYASETPHWGYSGGGDFPLDIATRRDVRITTAQLQALQAYYDYGETIWSVRTDLEKARVDFLAASSELQAATESVELRGRRAQLVEHRISAGQDARAAGLLAQGDLAAAERRLVGAKGRRQAAIVDLAKALGVGPSTIGGIRLVAPQVVLPFSDLALRRRDAALSRRDVLRAIADYDLAEQALRLEIANQYPTFNLGPGYNYDHGVTKLPFNLALVLPPRDLNRRAIAQAEAARTAAGKSLELAQANALSAVDMAAAALKTAQDDFERARDSAVPAAQKADAAAARAVAAGESDRVDALATRGAMVDAVLDMLDAQHAAAAAVIDLEDALRGSFDPGETAQIEKAMTEVKKAR